MKFLSHQLLIPHQKQYEVSGVNNSIDVKIGDNDAPPVIELSLPAGQTIRENGSFNIQVDIAATSASQSSENDIVVRYQITDSTLADFIAEEDQMGTITITAGATSETETIDIQNNFVDRDDSSVEVVLLDDRGVNKLYTKSAVESTNTISVPIEDNDAPPVIRAVFVGDDPIITEGNSVNILFSIIS